MQNFQKGKSDFPSKKNHEKITFKNRRSIEGLLLEPLPPCLSNLRDSGSQATLETVFLDSDFHSYEDVKNKAGGTLEIAVSYLRLKQSEDVHIEWGLPSNGLLRLHTWRAINYLVIRFSQSIQTRSRGTNTCDRLNLELKWFVRSTTCCNFGLIKRAN